MRYRQDRSAMTVAIGVAGIVVLVLVSLITAALDSEMYYRPDTIESFEMTQQSLDKN